MNYYVDTVDYGEAPNSNRWDKYRVKITFAGIENVYCFFDYFKALGFARYWDSPMTSRSGTKFYK